jgi:hypothetical protein
VGEVQRQRQREAISKSKGGACVLLWWQQVDREGALVLHSRL